jgi:hypothetical protein
MSRHRGSRLGELAMMSDNASAQTDTASRAVLGRWRIIAWRQDYDDGRVTHPFGETIHGFVQYNADATMLLQLTAGARRQFETGGQWNAADAEKAHADSTCLAYAGTFSVTEDEIHHKVEISLFPNWVGGTQTRRATLNEGQLQLIARLEDGTSEARTATLAWQRSEPGKLS